MNTMLQTEQIELPWLEGFCRTPFGFYVCDHKTRTGRTPEKTFKLLYDDGVAPIPNTYESIVVTLTKHQLARIENPDIREETRKAQELMLKYPAMFVGLIAVGNRVLIEPHGFGTKTLPEKLVTGHIETYDHDASKIRTGLPQARYKYAELVVDDSANDFDIRHTTRYGDWGAAGRRFNVVLDYGPRGSNPNVAGLGFRLAGNEAYTDAGRAQSEFPLIVERARALARE